MEPNAETPDPSDLVGTTAAPIDPLLAQLAGACEIGAFEGWPLRPHPLCGLGPELALVPNPTSRRSAATFKVASADAAQAQAHGPQQPALIEAADRTENRPRPRGCGESRSP